MENLKIVSLNIDDKAFKIRSVNKTVEMISDLLSKYDVDILSLQGVNIFLADALDKYVFKKSNGYHFIYDYHNIKLSFPYKINEIRYESSPFITKFGDSFGHDIKLNSSTDPTKRHLSRLVVNPFIDGICVLNVKLNRTDPKINDKQINELIIKIKNYIRLYSNPSLVKLFITGDFGFNIDNDSVKHLITELYKLDLKSIFFDSNISENIFIPSSYEVIDSFLIDEYNFYHKPLIVNIMKYN